MFILNLNSEHVTQHDHVVVLMVVLFDAKFKPRVRSKTLSNHGVKRYTPVITPIIVLCAVGKTLLCVSNFLTFSIAG